MKRYDQMSRDELIAVLAMLQQRLDLGSGQPGYYAPDSVPYRSSPVRQAFQAHEVEYEQAVLDHTLRAGLDALPMQIAILDASSTIIAVNESWRRFATANGFCGTDYALGCNYLAVCDQAVGRDAEFAQVAAAGIRAVIARQRDEFFMEYPCHSPTQKRWFVLRVIRFAQVEPLRLVVMHEDVTPLKVTEAALRESEECYRRIVETAEEGIWIIDTAAQVVFANARMAALLGYAVSDIVGQPLLAFMDEEGRAQALAALGWCRQGRKGQYDLTFRRSDGTTVWAIGSLNPFQDQRGAYAGVLGMVTDITERRQAQQEHLTLERRLMETQKLESLGMLAGGIAHDFNNLLTGILGYASLALLDLPPDASVRGDIEQIEVLAQRAATLTRQMLDYTGKGHVSLQRIDINALIVEMLPLLRTMVAGKAEVIYRPTPGLLLVEADCAQLRQVVMNLVSHAATTMAAVPGSITIATGMIDADRTYLAETYLASDLAPGCYVYLEVADTGLGMDEDALAKIFDPFFTGQGMGLAVVLGVVRAHHGTLKVRSMPGRGTVFTILLPCATVTNQVAPSPPAALPDGLAGPPTVLIVDDEQHVRTLTARIAEMSGYRVLLASDGREAIVTFRAHADDIAVVLLDMTMPQLSGAQVFGELRRIRPDVPVVLMSGYSEADIASSFHPRDLAGFLQKPFTPADLRSRLQQALRQR